jgi:single-strand DNA-binding protein
MNETMMTICGNVVDVPKLRRTKNGHWVGSFRVASTQRRFDRDQGAWVDGDTLFVSVTAWRGFGENVAQSLRKGDPVVVHGRYYQREYLKDELPRTAYELDAVSVGHDLSRGVATFERVVRSVTPSFPIDETGGPQDSTADFIDFEEDVPEGVDRETGEVAELTPA